MNLTSIENHFKHQQQLLGNLADEESFNMIYSLIEKVRKLEAETDKLAALNRHYLNHFYGGEVLKMLADFKYLKGS